MSIVRKKWFVRLSCRILGLRPLNHRLQLLNGDVLMVVPRATSYVFIREVCSKTFSYPKPTCSQLLPVWKTLVLSQGFSLCERVRVFSMCCYGATGTGREKKNKAKEKTHKMQVRVFNSGSSSGGSEGFSNLPTSCWVL